MASSTSAASAMSAGVTACLNTRSATGPRKKPSTRWSWMNTEPPSTSSGSALRAGNDDSAATIAVSVRRLGVGALLLLWLTYNVQPHLELKYLGRDSTGEVPLALGPGEHEP